MTIAAQHNEIGGRQRISAGSEWRAHPKLLIAPSLCGCQKSSTSTTWSRGAGSPLATVAITTSLAVIRKGMASTTARRASRVSLHTIKMLSALIGSQVSGSTSIGASRDDEM